jgi:hypothetical protein
MFYPKFEERYYKKVNKLGDDDCWLWTGATLPNGYGLCWTGKERKLVYAHRAAVEMALGRPLAPGMDAAHSCRNRNCVAPHHLREATRQENCMDKVRDGTMVRGERVWSSKLTEADVRAIRNDDRKLREIAADYDLNLNTVWKIKSRLQWAWLD